MDFINGDSTAHVHVHAHVHTCRLDDLVVGAPMYSDISTDSDYEYGRVYVFRNDEVSTCTYMHVHTYIIHVVHVRTV